MKILQILAGGRHGGAEMAFVDMCIAMKAAGHDIEVITRPNAHRVPLLEEAGLTVHKMRFGGRWDFCTSLKIKKIIARFQPQIVQTWMSRASQKTPQWDKASGLPRYVTVARLGNYYKMKYFRSSEYFVAITPLIKEYIEKEGQEPVRVRHINNFAETEKVERPVRRQGFNTPEEAPLLLALGRLHQAKAIDTLLKAVAQVPDIYLWVAGEGPDRAELEDLSASLGLTDRVRFLGWRTDRAALFAASDICVFPSRFEPFGTVFVQAWAQKKPLIVSQADGPRQFVRHEEDGLIFPIDDEAALAHEIERLAKNKSLQESLSRAGYRRYEQEFTKEKTVEAYLDFYQEIFRREGVGAEAQD